MVNYKLCNIELGTVHCRLGQWSVVPPRRVSCQWPLQFTIHNSLFSLYPSPFTLHPLPFILHPLPLATPCSLFPVPYSLFITAHCLLFFARASISASSSNARTGWLARARSAAE